MRAVGPGGLVGWVIISLLASTFARGQITAGYAPLPARFRVLTKNHCWLKAFVETPNDLLFPLDETCASPSTPRSAEGAFNTNVDWGQTLVSGPSYGLVTAFPDPRVLRLGLSYEF